ncbi:hypothetical protein T4E_4301 [Trichinella pseudospiralis]|uniref:Uncharacterized protein n=1 Tax=Trichinella pseudospiralis TaxID=6337 RepID=A0A0V0Y351_TRIPS|nr:hypothetical protein T4E_4301 [Trichinella pseudospiralis]KRY85453.1 hypothetical protein T4D_1237 [Trichinella pseudospiralis]
MNEQRNYSHTLLFQVTFQSCENTHTYTTSHVEVRSSLRTVARVGCVYMRNAILERQQFAWSTNRTGPVCFGLGKHQSRP